MYIIMEVSINGGTPIAGGLLSGKTYWNGWSEGTPISGNLHVNKHSLFFGTKLIRPKASKGFPNTLW